MTVALTKVVQGYGRHIVLHDVSVEFSPGVTALLGPNAAGKSTLMRTLVTDLRPKSGTVVIGGAPITSRRARERARRLIGYLPQSFGHDPRFTVTEHVEYMAWLRGVASSARLSESKSAISVVDLEEQADRKLGSLSGGSLQRAGIAGAIVGSPDLLVLDEPTVGLDPGQRAAFRELVRRLPATYIVLSTHLTDDVEAVAGHVVLLAEGRIVAAQSIDNFTYVHGSVELGYLAAVAEERSPA